MSMEPISYIQQDDHYFAKDRKRAVVECAFGWALYQRVDDLSDDSKAEFSHVGLADQDGAHQWLRGDPSEEIKAYRTWKTMDVMPVFAAGDYLGEMR